MLFPGNLLNGTEKTKSKPGETTTEIYNKPSLMQITKFTTMQNNHDSLVQTVFLVAYLCAAGVEEFLLRLRCSPLYINRHQSLGRIGILKNGVLMFLNFVVSSRNLACR